MSLRKMYKQPRQESGLFCFSFACYLQKCVTQIYRALYGGRKVTQTSVTQFCYWNKKLVL